MEHTALSEFADLNSYEQDKTERILRINLADFLERRLQKPAYDQFEWLANFINALIDTVIKFDKDSDHSGTRRKYMADILRCYTYGMREWRALRGLLAQARFTMPDIKAMDALSAAAAVGNLRATKHFLHEGAMDIFKETFIVHPAHGVGKPGFVHPLEAAACTCQVRILKYLLEVIESWEKPQYAPLHRYPIVDRIHDALQSAIESAQPKAIIILYKFLRKHRLYCSSDHQRCTGGCACRNTIKAAASGCVDTVRTVVHCWGSGRIDHQRFVDKCKYYTFDTAFKYGHEGLIRQLFWKNIQVSNLASADFHKYHYRAIADILIENELEVEGTYWNPLLCASISGNIAMMHFLVQRGSHLSGEALIRIEWELEDAKVGLYRGKKERMLAYYFAFELAGRTFPQSRETPLLKELVRDIEADDRWKAMVAEVLTPKEIWVVPGEKLFGQHLLDQGF